MTYLLKYVSRAMKVPGYRRFWGSNTPQLVFSEEVRVAKSLNDPIVALESTIITHGMPYPKNLETALQVEDIIRKQGATPATIAILKGQLTVGLTENQLRDLAQAKDVVKASRRDLAPIIAKGLDGATTVAGTIIAAELADIPVFVTGGIGGVHREGESTMDVSADLNELGRSKTMVICSGVKSILDIGRTLEYLETQGVCVCSFGKTTDFPAFYTTLSGHHAPYKLDNATQAARLLQAAYNLHLNSGIVVAVPVPEEHAMDEIVIENAINKALEDAKRKGIQGKEVTPFILAAVANVTRGASLETNIALIKNNARVGADIAVEFKKLKNLDNSFAGNIGFSGSSPANSRRHFHTSCATRDGKIDKCEDWPLFTKTGNELGDVLVIGGSNMDRTYRVTEDRVQLDGSTHPCKVEQFGGGVGRNVAEALWRLRGGRVRLLTAVGEDDDGQNLQQIAPGLFLDGCIMKGYRTASYAAILDSKGECLMGLGDMDIHNKISIDLVEQHIKILKQSPLVVLDGNVPQETIDHVLKICNELRKPVFFEPTDHRKAMKPLKGMKCIKFASPNVSELQAMATVLRSNDDVQKPTDVNEILQLCQIVSEKVEFLIITMGSQGVITVQKLQDGKLEGRLYSVNQLKKIENVSGAGDCFASGFIYAVLLGFNPPSCITFGLEAAKCALLSRSPVPLNIGTIFSTQEIKDAVYKKVNFTELNEIKPL